jgi:hypothetical protein
MDIPTLRRANDHGANANFSFASTRSTAGPFDGLHSGIADVILYLF